MSAQTAHRTNKIVVVDDDARIRDLLRRYLTQEGFEVMVAEDGKASAVVSVTPDLTRRFSAVDLVRVASAALGGKGGGDGIGFFARRAAGRPQPHPPARPLSRPS